MLHFFLVILQAASKENDEVVVTPSSSNATTPGGEIPNSDILGNPPGGSGKRAEVEDIQLLQLRLQEAQCRNMVIEAEMEELKTRVRHHT